MNNFKKTMAKEIYYLYEDGKITAEDYNRLLDILTEEWRKWIREV